MVGCPPGAGDRAEHFRADGYDTGTWDADAAMSKCSSSSTPATCFGSICAARVSAEPADTQDGWALPHHKEAGGVPSKAGVSAALGRVDQTDGIDRDKARAHLNSHAALWNGGSSKGADPAEMRSLAAAVRAEHMARRGRPDDGARMATFGAQFRHQPVVVQGKELHELDGYASVVEQRYPMWDMFGEYGETIAATAFDATLAAGPDVAFLVNHRGVSMARSKGGSPTLTLDADPRGLHMRALLNPARTDVRDLLTAIDDENITEMSFAFMILDWEWNEDYTECRIESVDLDRGDVSAVNFGANPYTSISARSQEVMALLPHLPEGVARSAMAVLGQQLGIPVHTIERLGAQAAEARAGAPADPVAAGSRGRSHALVERLLDLD